MSERRRSMAALATEFVVIVVGVLVALGVDEWRESRKEARIETFLIEGLINDLVADSGDIAQFLSGGEWRSQRGEFLIAVARGEVATPEEVGAAFRGLTAAVKLDIVESTYREIVGSGGSQSLSDPRARLEVAGYYGLALNRQNINSYLAESQDRVKELLLVRGYTVRDGAIPLSVAREPEVAAAVREAAAWAAEAARYPRDLAEKNASLLALLRGTYGGPPS